MKSITKCDYCHKEFERELKDINRHKKHFCSKACYCSFKNPSGATKNVGLTGLSSAEYFRVHHWLIYNFGKAAFCSHCTEGKNFHWALKKGCKYEKNLENFIPLCVSCHRLYDYRESTRKLISQKASLRTGSLHPKSKLVLNTETGIFYESVTEVAKLCGIRNNNMCKRLNGKTKNKTSFIYV